ncbi:MAG: hypothetical protein CVV27_02495 [Candidatus Melainabacteria bacterium HGW-Melainabacteria-1]|nr:MAG: hypothetical protein CVV27_02495 [Candidatus Melainabacteria bacterium HGW-Melainabacteria-1]
MLEFLKRVCRIFEQQQLDYMLSGSLALNIYTIPRMTRDIDIVIAIEESALAPFLACFPDDAYYVSPQAALEAVRQYRMFNLIDYASGFKLDLIVLKPEPYRQTEFHRRVKTDILGFSAYVVQPEDLILSKLLWIQELDSERQRSDIRQLLNLENLDREYLLYWARQLQLNSFGYLDRA